MLHFRRRAAEFWHSSFLMAICWRHCTSRCLTQLHTPSTADGPKDGPVHVEEIVGLFLVSTWHVLIQLTSAIGMNQQAHFRDQHRASMAEPSGRWYVRFLSVTHHSRNMHAQNLLTNQVHAIACVVYSILCMFVFVTYSFNYVYACSFHSTLHCGPVAMAFGEKRPLLVPSTVTWYRSGKGRLQGTTWNQQRLSWSLIHSWIFMVFSHEWMGNIWKLNGNKRIYVTTMDLSPCSPMTFPRLRTRRSLRPVSFWRGHLMIPRSWRLKHEIITLLGRHQSYFKYPTATSLWNKFESSWYIYIYISFICCRNTRSGWGPAGHLPVLGEKRARQRKRLLLAQFEMCVMVYLGGCFPTLLGNGHIMPYLIKYGNV